MTMLQPRSQARGFLCENLKQIPGFSIHRLTRSQRFISLVYGPIFNQITSCRYVLFYSSRCQGMAGVGGGALAGADEFDHRPDTPREDGS